jgi:hypothetical protein
MFISDLFETPDGYRTEKDDNTVLSISDLRKTKLTLGQINRLRAMNDVRKFEREKKIDVISKQYKPAEEPAAPAL